MILDESIEEINNNLASKDRPTVLAALVSLSGFVSEGKANISSLGALDALMEGEDLEIRKEALLLVGKHALKKIGHPESVQCLNDMLRDPDPDIRENAAWALGELAGIDVGELCTPYYLNYTLKDEVAEVRAMSAWAEGRYAEKMGVGRNDTYRLLTELLQDDSLQVRKGAEWALQRLKEIGIQ